jgi:hypothetical protein
MMLGLGCNLLLCELPCQIADHPLLFRECEVNHPFILPLTHAPRRLLSLRQTPTGLISTANGRRII